MIGEMIKKGKGRIYVADEARIPEVIKLIQELDPFEYEYFSEDIVSPYKGEVELVYTWKFELNLDLLTSECWKRGIFIWCITIYAQNEERFLQDLIPKIIPQAEEEKKEEGV